MESDKVSKDEKSKKELSSQTAKEGLKKKPLGKSFLKKWWFWAALVIVLIAVITTAILIDKQNKQRKEEEEQARIEENKKLVEGFKNAYLLKTTSGFSQEQSQCVWIQIESLVNENDLLDAAKEYADKGIVASDGVFANKVYSSINGIYGKCNIETDNAEKTIDEITDVINLEFNGTGTQSTDIFKLKKGVATATITGSGTIYLLLYPTDGGYNVWSSSSLGDPRSDSQTYSLKISVPYDGEYYLEVDNTSYNYSYERIIGKDWKVNIRQE